MDALLTSWLSELQRDPVSFGPEPGSGAHENLWAISVPSDRSDITADQLVEFLLEAQHCRLEQAIRAASGPVVFYAWNDEMAGQLRFSVARGTLDHLPFGAQVEIVSDVRQIATEHLASRYRDGIPWSELVDVSFSFEEPSTDTVDTVRVWGVSLS